ncbi:MAG: hypothetical protein R2760_03885 [Chitinophagales bacterium]
MVISIAIPVRYKSILSTLGNIALFVRKMVSTNNTGRNTLPPKISSIIGV